MCRKLVALVLILAFAGSAWAGLAARYTFDDGTAVNVGGSAGAAADGALEGGVGIVMDAGGNGGLPWDPDKAASMVLSLDGIDDGVNLGGGGGGWGDLNGDAIVTAMAWYKYVTIDGQDTNFDEIVCKGTGESNGWSLNRYGRNSDVAFQSLSNPDWQGLPSGNADALDGQWHHAAGQFRPEGDYGNGWEQATGNIYVDGMLWNSSNRWGSSPTNVTDVTIGYLGGDGRRWSGYIDDVRIYDEFLSGAQIYDCYMEGIVPEPATIALLGLGGLALLRKKR